MPYATSPKSWAGSGMVSFLQIFDLSRGRRVAQWFNENKPDPFIYTLKLKSRALTSLEVKYLEIYKCATSPKSCAGSDIVSFLQIFDLLGGRRVAQWFNENKPDPFLDTLKLKGKALTSLEVKYL